MDDIEPNKRNLRIAYVVYRALQSIPVLLALLVGLVVIAATTPYDFVGLTDTQYASGYSKAGWRTLSVGDSTSEVLKRIGEPHSRLKNWQSVRWTWELTGVEVVFDDSMVISVSDPKGVLAGRIEQGMSHARVLEILGVSSKQEDVSNSEIWSYSRSPKSTHYWRVFLEVDATTQTVVRKTEEFYFD